MNISSIKHAAKLKGARQLLVARKHSPQVLFGAGVVGVVATAVLSSKATLQLEETLEEINKQKRMAKTLNESGDVRYGEEAYKRDMAILMVRSVTKVAKLYMPAIIVGTASIAALTSSHVILTKRNVALTAAYAAVDKGFREYRDRVIAELGEEKDREFLYETEKQEVVEKTDKGEKKSEVTEATGASIYARFFDELCVDWKPIPEYNRVFLQAKQNYANDLLNMNGHVFLNEVYDMLGLPRTKAGAVVGWVRGKGDSFVDFGIFNADSPAARDFVNGREGAILLDFNVAGVIYDLI
jgi:hypothetical protein